MIKLKWFFKNRNGYYYELNTINLEQPHFDRLHGVYVVWYCDSSSPVIVYTGQGMIKKRFKAHRCNKRIQKYAADNTLYATWAKIGKNGRTGVEAYLHKKLKPIVPKRAPTAVPIPVNLPWEEN